MAVVLPRAPLCQKKILFNYRMRSRGWCFTRNNYTDEDLGYCIVCPYRYIVVGFEEGEKGTPHLQGYVYFDNARWFDSVKKMFPKFHIEAQKGSFEEAVEYCKKDGYFWENGDAPHPGKVDRQKIEEIMANPWAHFHLYNQYKKSYNELVNKEKKTHTRKLYIIDENEKYNVLKKLKDRDVSIYPSEYDGESVMIVPCFCQTTGWVKDWIQGYPHKIRIGYEIKYVDPEIVYIMYADSSEHRYLLKNYIDYIDAEEKSD